MPYWGDSIYADRMDYRHDTPLQCTIDGVAVAQCFIFGMFGVDPQFDGTHSRPPAPGGLRAETPPSAGLRSGMPFSTSNSATRSSRCSRVAKPSSRPWAA